MTAPGLSSLIDSVDEADEPVGTIARGDVLSLGLNFRVVHIFVFDRTGRLLLQRLGASRDRNPLHWGSSVAGYLHAGEAPAAGARRRLFEELAIGEDVKLVGEVSMQDGSSTKFIRLFAVQTEASPRPDPTHIATVRYLRIGRVDWLVHRFPGAFTDTFRLVFDFYRSLRELKVIGEPA